MQEERYWKLILKQTKGLPVAQSTLERTRRVALVDQHAPKTIKEALLQLQAAKHQRKCRQQRHKQLRENYLESLASSLVLKKSPHINDPKYASRLEMRMKEAVNCILKKERRRQMYRAIGNCLKPVGDNIGGIARVDVPAPASGIDPTLTDPKTWAGPWQSVTDPEEIAFHISKANQKQYNQAEDTPFGSGPLAKAIGDLLSSKVAKDILEGAFTP